MKRTERHHLKENELELLTRQRPVEVEALGELAPHLSQHVRLLGGLDSLGHGPHAEALAELTRAIAGKPKTREWAREDEDFKSLRGDPEFEALLGS